MAAIILWTVAAAFLLGVGFIGALLIHAGSRLYAAFDHAMVWAATRIITGRTGKADT